MTIKRSVAGLRGTTEPGAGGVLSPDVVLDWARAYGTALARDTGTAPLVAVARDGRRSSPLLQRLVIAGVLSTGCPVIDFGIAPTPTLQLLVHLDRSLRGGVMITASHNPVQWNGLKFLTPDGLHLSGKQWSRLAELREKKDFQVTDLRRIPWSQDGSNDALEAHVNVVGHWSAAEEIRNRDIRVVIDACNSAAGKVASELVSRSGCRVIVIHGEITGAFSRPPEPLPENLSALSHMVKRSSADVGFAFDPDGDRLALVDEQGSPIGEERTITLCARYLLSRSSGDAIVTNVSTTHALEDLAAAADRPVGIVRTPVGEAHVVGGVLQLGPERVVIAGEGSGGVIIPEVNLARDGIAAMGAILSLMATEEKPLSQLVAELPQWSMGKARWTCDADQAQALREATARWHESGAPPTVEPDPAGRKAIALSGAGIRLELAIDGGEALLTLHGADLASLQLASAVPDPLPAVLERLAQADSWQVHLTDGVKIVGEEGSERPAGVWVHVRPSNTEPIIRLIGEMRE
jgi:phosphomannomutase